MFIKATEKTLKILTVFLALIAAVTLSAGCTGKSHTLTYNALSWEEVKNAEGYRIYDGDALIGETTDTAFLLRPDAGQHNIRLESFEGEKSKQIAEFSYSVPALSEKIYNGADAFEEEQTSEESYFSAAQHLKIDYTGSGKAGDEFTKVINLASNVRKVSIISDRRITVRASFVIQKRTEDIEFELENIVLQGLENEQYAISYDGGYTASSGCLILKLFGVYNAVLCGYVAPKGEDGERSGWFKHGETGGNGGDGGGAISAGEIYVISEGDAVFTGGNGGIGGNGGDAGGINKVGNGGNGGKGGNAVTGTKFSLFMLNGAFSASGGSGGTGGKRGNPVDSGGLTSDRYDGKAGADGTGLAVTEKIALRGDFGEDKNNENA